MNNTYQGGGLFYHGLGHELLFPPDIAHRKGHHDQHQQTGRRGQQPGRNIEKSGTRQ